MINVVPYPNKVTLAEGELPLSKSFNVVGDAPFQKQALRVKTALSAQNKLSPDGARFYLRHVPELGAEAYRLTVDAQGITLEASETVGLFYAVQTLSQLSDGGKPLPYIAIDDAPRFKWRGLMLDVSRHFFDVATVKELLDVMASLKLNVFHFHLTDDNGWRVDIKKYPLHKEVGSKRDDTHIHGWNMADREGKPHEGCYSQEEIKEIVAYASELHIDVVPELDMPAHFRAAIAAYPYLACRKIASSVPWYFATPAKVEGSKEDYTRIACAGKETTYRFIFDVLDEICELFPSLYFHIGGDEAPKDEWKKCPCCQKTIREQGLKDEEDLQSYFNHRVAEYLKAKGKTLVCWNDGMRGEGKIDRSIVCQYFSAARDKAVVRHMAEGGKVVVSKFQGFYFDMPHSQISLKKAYKYDIFKDGIDAKLYGGNVAGVEGTLWTEWIASRGKLEFQALPRALACAEQGWCFKRGSYRAFSKRAQKYITAATEHGIQCAPLDVATPKNIFKANATTATWYASNPDVEYEAYLAARGGDVKK